MHIPDIKNDCGGISFVCIFSKFPINFVEM